MSLAPTSPTPGPYTQPATPNSAIRNTITIYGDGHVVVLVNRLDSTGTVIEQVQLSVPQAGGNVTDQAGRIYGTVSDGTFTTAIATACAQVDGAIAAYAAAGKFDR